MVIARSFRENLINSRFFFKPKFEPVVKNRYKGPEQRCNIGFRCSEINLDRVLTILSNNLSVKVL